MRLKLLCHASTAAVRDAAFPADEPLDAFGAAEAGGRLETRARRGSLFDQPGAARPADGGVAGPDAHVEPALRDCDYGRWTGRTLAELEAEEPQAVAEWLRAPEAAPHGGESLLALIERVANWLDAQRQTKGATLAVTHASVIRAAIVYALGAGPQSFWRIDVAPLSLTRLSGNGGRWTLASVGPMTAEGGP